MKAKKIVSLLLVLTLVLGSSTSVFAATPDLSVEESEVITLTATDMKANVEDALEKGQIDSEYATQLIDIIEKHTSSSISENKGDYSVQRVGNNEDAVIIYTPTPALPTHGLLTMNEEGYQIIKEIINIGGGGAATGAGVFAAIGMSVGAGVAAALGGVLLMSSGSIALQFALGYEYASITF